MDATSTKAINGLFDADPDRDYIVLSHSVSRPLHYKLSRLIEANKSSDACTVFLTTYGGDPDGGYRIARSLRHYYTRNVRLVVPSFCKSAGTLIAIAADELAIGDFGELGPLDIQVRKASELQESSSGLDIMQALQAVTLHAQETFHRMLVESRSLGLSTKLCAEFAGKVVSGIAAPLFAQIDPIRLGEMQRATRVAYEYGRRLNVYTKNLKEGALVRLINEYPAHGFVIDRKEAGELFERVSHPTSAENEFCRVFWPHVSEQLEADPIKVERVNDCATGNDHDEESAAQRDAEEGRKTGEAGTGCYSAANGGGDHGKDASGPDAQGLRIRPHGFAVTKR